MKSVAIRVMGKVQGVWFRASTQRKAAALRLTGFVANQSDGSVYLEVQGDDQAIDDLIEWCKVGPPHANVDRTVVNDIPPFQSEDFVILR